MYKPMSKEQAVKEYLGTKRKKMNYGYTEVALADFKAEEPKETKSKTKAKAKEASKLH
jgi:hypothetical protein